MLSGELMEAFTLDVRRGDEFEMRKRHYRNQISRRFNSQLTDHGAINPNFQIQIAWLRELDGAS